MMGYEYLQFGSGDGARTIAVYAAKDCHEIRLHVKN